MGALAGAMASGPVLAADNNDNEPPCKPQITRYDNVMVSPPVFRTVTEENKRFGERVGDLVMIAPARFEMRPVFEYFDPAMCLGLTNLTNDQGNHPDLPDSSRPGVAIGTGGGDNGASPGMPGSSPGTPGSTGSSSGGVPSLDPMWEMRRRMEESQSVLDAMQDPNAPLYLPTQNLGGTPSYGGPGMGLPSVSQPGGQNPSMPAQPIVGGAITSQEAWQLMYFGSDIVTAGGQRYSAPLDRREMMPAEAPPPSGPAYVAPAMPGTGSYQPAAPGSMELADPAARRAKYGMDDPALAGPVPNTPPEYAPATPWYVEPAPQPMPSVGAPAPTVYQAAPAGSMEWYHRSREQ